MNVYNVSVGGCRVDCVERLALDEVVWIKFDALEALEASVCWIEGYELGLEFRREIHPAVLVDLVRKLNRTQLQ